MRVSPDVPARTRIDKLFGSNKPEWGVMRGNGDIAPPPDHLMTHGMARRWVKAQKNPKDYHAYSSVPKRTGPGEFPQGPGKFPDRNELFY